MAFTNDTYDMMKALERCIVDELPAGPVTEDEPTPGFEIMEGATTRGRKKLFWSGYSYTVKREKGETATWRCTKRSKRLNCKATVRQTADKFALGPIEHIHGPEAGLASSLTIKAKIKAKTRCKAFQSAGEIVESAWLQNLNTHQTCESLLGTVSLARSVNRVRAKLRPQDPRDLDFKVDTEHMVSSKQYEAVFQMLEEERAAHSETKNKLSDTLDQLAFCQGEVEVLSHQIAREKAQFEQTFGLLKTKALTETVKNIELENKCHEIEKQCEDRTDILSDKDHQIEALTRRLQSQKDHYERKLSELTIQMKQEAYIAQTLVDGNTGHRS